jgi:glucosamine--fructose-6-phosphate aminotransferase (isomerizing)
MCGIIAVLRTRSSRSVPSGAGLTARLDAAVDALMATDPSNLSVRVREASGHVADVDLELHGVPGVLALLQESSLAAELSQRLTTLRTRGASLEQALDAGELSLDGAALEEVNAALLALKDGVWGIERDRLRTAEAVGELAGAHRGEAAIGAYLSIQLALSALDRLEVRGRDSAGLHVLVDRHGLDLADEAVAAEIERRGGPLFTSGSVRIADGNLGFVYKAAAEIGELGDNTAALRAAISADELLRRALTADAAEATVLGHTRWASVGIISEPNAHPLNSEEEGRVGTPGPYVLGALNGDVDNYAALKADAGLRVPPEISTDAKVIPTLVSRAVADGQPLEDAFRTTVARFEGSVAIGASSASTPGQLLLALRGSGQALYVGFAEDSYLVASEPYGLVEETRRYLRMEGEAASGVDGSAGQIIVLSREGAGGLGGVRRVAYDGTELPVAEAQITTAEITTRDIDRAGAPHFLLKEIGEAPQSIRKTLRGKLEERKGLLAVRLPEGTLPGVLLERLADDAIRRIIVTGQGTAAMAARAAAASLSDAFASTEMRILPLTAAELSDFGMADDMSDTLVVAISQSGTSADTNRTVDLCRSRGAVVIGVVNRRNSDLVDKVDGVLFTSDGRDMEMAVPSTKAFYAQVAAGVLLAWGLAGAAGVGDRHRAAELLGALTRLPAAMEQVLARRTTIGAAAQRHCLSRRYWAMVGNGPNRIAAAELRIKLSELCYKSISLDITEDKKHVDLSAEPLIVVCAAGITGSTADDVAKEVAIFRAHKAAPIVIATDGEHRFDAALDVLWVPAVHPDLDFVLSAMAGHLFGYEAAVAIDGQARQLRVLRGAVEELLTRSTQPHELLERLAPAVAAPAERFFADLRNGSFNGHLETSTAVRLASLLRYAAGVVPLESFELEHGTVGSPAALVDDVLDALSDAIDELTRPIDAIKHQAKTVTVGISRAEDSYADVPLVQEVLATGAGRDRIGYKSLRTLAELSPAVLGVQGYSRYEVQGDVAAGTATIHRIDSGGIARDLPSRTDSDPALKGTKRRAAFEREVTVSRSSHDGRTTVIIPETKDNQVTGITLMHVDLVGRLETRVARQVLTGYRNRYNAIVDAVTETEPSFRDEVLGEVSMVDLMVEPVHVLAAHWRR